MVAVTALLVGSGATAAVLLMTDRFGQSRHEYRVTVFLDNDITAEQKAEVRSTMARMRPVDGIGFETREQAWEKFRETFKDQPELINSAKPEALPESFHLTTTGAEFDCAAMALVRDLPGVEKVTVVQPATDGRPGAVITCP